MLLAPKATANVSKSAFTQQAERLRDLLIGARRTAGLTQVQLAKRLRRPQSFVSKYERGERRLDVVEFLQVTDALRADPYQMIRALRGD